MNSGELAVLLLSLKVALISSMIIFLPSLFLGIWLARTSLKGRLVVEIIASAPLVLPPIATGYLLLLLFGTMLNGFWGAALASAVVSLPIFVRSVRVSAESLDVALEQVASNLGLSAPQVFWHITLPLLWPGLLGGFLLSFIRGLGEFGATVTFVGTMIDGRHTLATALWAALQDPHKEQEAQNLLIICLVLAMAALLLSEVVVRYLRSRHK